MQRFSCHTPKQRQLWLRWYTKIMIHHHRELSFVSVKRNWVCSGFDEFLSKTHKIKSVNWSRTGFLSERWAKKVVRPLWLARSWLLLTQHAYLERYRFLSLLDAVRPLYDNSISTKLKRNERVGQSTNRFRAHYHKEISAFRFWIKSQLISSSSFLSLLSFLFVLRAENYVINIHKSPLINHLPKLIHKFWFKFLEKHKIIFVVR